MGKKPNETSSENVTPVDFERGGPNHQSMLGKVFAPAIALLVTGVLNVIVSLCVMFNAIFAFAGTNTVTSSQLPNFEELATQAGGQAQASQKVMLDISEITGTVGIVFGIVMFVVAALIISGARKMKKLTGYRTAMAASILAMIPFLSGCCIIGLPIGIWSVVVLMNNEVKQSFR